MPASNATFLGRDRRTCRWSTSRSRGSGRCGTSRDGTLADREVAAYLVSEALGWDVVPQTWLRDGPHGPGWCSVWQEPDPEQEAVDLVARGRGPGRAGGTCFDGIDGQRPAGLAGPRGHRPRCAGWRSSTWWSTTPTARAATCWRWPTGTATASTTASPSTPSTSCARCCGAGPGEPLTDDGGAVLAELREAVDGRARRRRSPRTSRDREIARAAPGAAPGWPTAASCPQPRGELARPSRGRRSDASTARLGFTPCVRGPPRTSRSCP